MSLSVDIFRIIDVVEVGGRHDASLNAHRGAHDLALRANNVHELWLDQFLEVYVRVEQFLLIRHFF